MRLLDIYDLPEDAPLFGLSCVNLKKRRPEVMVVSMIDPEMPWGTFPFEFFGTARFPVGERGWRGLRPLTAAARKWQQHSKPKEGRRR